MEMVVKPHLLQQEILEVHHLEMEDWTFLQQENHLFQARELKELKLEWLVYLTRTFQWLHQIKLLCRIRIYMWVTKWGEQLKMSFKVHKSQVQTFQIYQALIF